MTSAAIVKCSTASKANIISETARVCSGRGRSYCLIHRRYFDTSWCPDCGRASIGRR